MTDLLAPSECAKLAAIEAKMTPGGWRVMDVSLVRNHVPRVESFVAEASTVALWDENGAMYERADAIGIVELRNAAPRLLRTIAAHEATIGELRKEAQMWRADADHHRDCGPCADDCGLCLPCRELSAGLAKYEGKV